MIGAREDDARRAVPARGLVQVVDTDNVRLQDRLERALDGDAAQVDHGLDALEEAPDRGGIGQVARHDFLAGPRIAQLCAIGDAQDAGEGLQPFAQHASQPPRSAGEEDPVELGSGGHRYEENVFPILGIPLVPCQGSARGRAPALR